MNSRQFSLPPAQARGSPSAPIQIPMGRDATINAFSSSPIEASLSPELLFDMSPISPSFPSPYLGFSASQCPRDNERFMYTFPTLGPQFRKSDPDTARRRLSQDDERVRGYPRATVTVLTDEELLPVGEPKNSVFFSHLFDSFSAQQTAVTAVPIQAQTGPSREAYPWLGKTTPYDPSSELDPSKLDFRNYLMQRIEMESAHLRR